MSAFAALPGAVSEAHESAPPVVLHYGDPIREQRALASGDAVVDLTDRVVVEATGPDRLTWLHAITSQALDRVQPGTSTELLLLDQQGRVEHAAAVFDDGATTWLIVDAGDAEGLLAWLLKMRFRSRVELTRRDDLAVVGFQGDGAAAAAVRALPDTVIWDDPWTHVSPGGHQYADVAEHPGVDRPWHEALITLAQRDALAAADVARAGLLAAEALRIAAWRPRWATELDERLIPHEVDWLRSAVHLTKGCYRGQETVAKVHNLGHPPRRIVMLHLDGSDSVLPTRGDEVFDGDRVIGAITSSAMHHELGPVALAIVTRRTAPDAVLVVRSGETSIAASQEVIVATDAGATAEVPKITRLSRRPLREQ